mmetsp:Transcript_3281/g.6144  ORF Transcript_3281/g.6144 Transcript_3281/m.6144 type:complete len:90 (+) Transcript_3281:1604-1873(+)
MEIPYTNPNPEIFNPSLPLSLRYPANERMVMRTPEKMTRLPSENPRISKDGSPALLRIIYASSSNHGTLGSCPIVIIAAHKKVCVEESR